MSTANYVRFYDFVTESNRIEGILRPPYDLELIEHQGFLGRDLSVTSLQQFISVIQPDARLRDVPGLNVRVGNYSPPKGGPEVRETLEDILSWNHGSPYDRHVAYESLHPFTDGNGRSGRVLWLKDMGGLDKTPLGFLHHFYYQTLKNSGR